MAFRHPVGLRTHKERVWAVESCSAIGRHVARRPFADGKTVLDVPAKLSARDRMFATGQGRKTSNFYNR
jgi:transposase